jgi:hypothetical protein
MFTRLHFAFSNSYAEVIQQGVQSGASEIFLRGSLGIPRKSMPQIVKQDRPALLKFLELSYRVAQMRVSPFDLRPTQNELITEKVLGAKKRLDGGAWDRPIFVSKEGYILDGHHIWAAQVLNNNPVDVWKVDASISDLLKKAHAFLHRSSLAYMSWVGSKTW